MLKIKKLDHVAVAVDDVDEALPRYEKLLGVAAQERGLVPAQQTDSALLPIGETSLELISPKGNEALARFLKKRGPGLHHIALEVEGLEDALAALKALGVPLVDESPRPGARGSQVAFLHPKATGGLLIELVEAAEGGEGDP
jgi:methylmalonyl-CoA/ethylmalonyl-CoA epimerase